MQSPRGFPVWRAGEQERYRPWRIPDWLKACGRQSPAARLRSAIDTLELPLGVRHGGLGVLRARAIVGEHVDDDEVADRGRRPLVRRADAGSRQRALRSVRE